MFFKSFGAAAVLASLALSASAHAQANWPNKPINLIVSSAPGGTADFAARMYTEIVSRNIGQRFIIENRAGAGGVVAAQYMLDKAPDGYTLMQSVNGLHEIAPGGMNLSFDAINDFTLITPLATADNFLIVNKSLGVSTVKDLVALAKSSPKGLNFGTNTAGGPPHLMMEQFKIATGAPIEIIHYKASTALLNDFIAGRAQLTAQTYNAFAPAMEEGKVTIVAINRDQRSAKFPDVPTLAEAGLPGIAVVSWWGLVAPKGMPQPLVDRIHDEFAKAARDPELLARFAQQDMVPYIMPQKDFIASATANQKRLAKVIKDLNIKLE